MRRCEVMQEGEKYRLVRYEVGDEDELYPESGGRPGRGACEDLFIEPEDWDPVFQPGPIVGSGTRYWLNKDGTLCRILKR